MVKQKIFDAAVDFADAGPGLRSLLLEEQHLERSHARFIGEDAPCLVGCEFCAYDKRRNIARRNHRIVMKIKQYTAPLLPAILCISVAFGVGYWCGMYRVNDALPDCQEDEVLYPVDFTGAGKNVTSDYRCVPIDTLFDGKDY